MDKQRQKQKPERFSTEDILREESKLGRLEYIFDCNGEIIGAEEQIAANHKNGTENIDPSAGVAK